MSETTTTGKIAIPYFEVTGHDGKRLYSSKQWLNRFRHYIQRIHDVDTKPVLNGEEMTCSNWDIDMKAKVKEKFILAVGPSLMYDKTITDNHEVPESLTFEQLTKYFKEYFIPKTNTHHSRGELFMAHHKELDSPENYWRKLVELEKNRDFKNITPTHIDRPNRPFHALTLETLFLPSNQCLRRKVLDPLYPNKQNCER